jgi:hypothetical protein
MMPSTRATPEFSSSAVRTTPAPAITRIPLKITTVEWPAEKASPTDAGFRPSVTNLRVELSIIDTWSKS